MTRSILFGLFALISVGAMGVLPIACQSGGVGDPCTPEDEYDPQFAGFKLVQENIESRSFQCSTRICLVNHFKGRVSCPLGQDDDAIKPCNGPGDTTTCAAGQKCVESATNAPTCTTNADCTTAGTSCDVNAGVCVCAQSTADAFCEPVTPGSKVQVLKTYLCHTEGACQTADGTTAQNTGKQCCLPGTDTPVGVKVCGQCDKPSSRDADGAVYCSCRCCPKCCDDPDADKSNCESDKTLCGTACDPNFNFCSCPDGFACSEIRKNVGLGDAQLTGSYCIKKGSDYATHALCGAEQGVFCTE